MAYGNGVMCDSQYNVRSLIIKCCRRLLENSLYPPVLFPIHLLRFINQNCLNSLLWVASAS